MLVTAPPHWTQTASTPPTKLSHSPWLLSHTLPLIPYPTNRGLKPIWSHTKEFVRLWMLSTAKYHVVCRVSTQSSRRCCHRVYAPECASAPAGLRQVVTCSSQNPSRHSLCSLCTTSSVRCITCCSALALHPLKRGKACVCCGWSTGREG
jgi:hypothetical protein